MIDTFACISTYGSESCLIVFADDSEVELPESVAGDRRSFFLRENDHFLTNAGRWEVKWDDDQGTISHSMRPPALPQIPIDDHDADNLNPRSPAGEPALVHDVHPSSPLSAKDSPSTKPKISQRHASERPVKDDEGAYEPSSSRSGESLLQRSIPPDRSENELKTAGVAEAEQESMDNPQRHAHQVTEVTSHATEPTATSELAITTTRHTRTDTDNTKVRLGSTESSKDANSTEHKSPKLVTGLPQRPPLDRDSHDKENIAPELETATEEEAEETFVVAVKTNTSHKTAAEGTEGFLHQGNVMTGLSASEDSDTPRETPASRKRKAEQHIGQRAREKKRRLGVPPPSNTDDSGDEVVLKMTGPRTTGPPPEDTTTVTQPAAKRRSRHRTAEATTPRASNPRSARTPRNKTPASSAEIFAGISRSRASSTSSTIYDGPEPKVYFASNTSIDRKKGAMKALQELGGVKVTDINAANFLCVKDDKLDKSSSLLQAILQGMHIVTERWISASQRNGNLPDPENYIPSDPDRELEWSFEIASAVRRGRDGFPPLLADITVWFTQRLKQSLKTQVLRDLSNVASGLGAGDIKFGIPPHQALLHGSVEDVVVGIENDPQAARVGRLGHHLYDKDLLTMAVFRGKLDLESTEFRVRGSVKEELDDE